MKDRVSNLAGGVVTWGSSPSRSVRLVGALEARLPSPSTLLPASWGGPVDR